MNKTKILEIILWLIFIPTAFFLAMLSKGFISIIFNSIDNLIYFNSFSNIVRNILIGFSYSITFFLGGLATAPKKITLKNILIVLTMILSFIVGLGLYIFRSADDFFFFLPNTVALLLPIALVWGIWEINIPSIKFLYYKNLANIFPEKLED